MPTIILKIFRLANPLAAALCTIIALCASPITTAEPEVVRIEGAHAEGLAVTRAPAPKKKIALVQFDVANTQHVDDINNIYDGLPLALAARLDSSGEFLTTYTGRSIPMEAGEAQRKVVTQIAEEAGAQFLIYGMVVNAGTSQAKKSLDMPFGWSMDVPFSSYTKRYIEIELVVYDGLTGAHLLQRRLEEQTQGEVRVGNDKPFGSSIFFETQLGQALNRLLDLAVKDIRTALENVPFSAHIIRVGAKKVFLDAGSDSLLKPGDQLVVFAEDAAPVVGLKGAVLGVTDRAVDTITLTDVQRQFAVGEPSEEAAKPRIKAGHIARIDPVEQRKLAAKQIEAQQAAQALREASEEAERVKVEKATQAEAARIKAEQEAKAEAARVKAEKVAAAQAAAEARVARLKAQQEARAVRIKAVQEARAKEQARVKMLAAAEAKAAKLKARQEAKAEAACIKAEKMPQTGAQVVTGDCAQPKTNAAAETTKPATEPRPTEELKPVKQEPKAAAAPKSTKVKTTPKVQAGMEVRAVAIEDLQREAAEAEAAASAPQENKKTAVPLKLKQIRP